MNKQPLKIYKASAGSGKTYRLALEYIKLVISNPWCYDKILAVTFTNKATKEMKNRILKELYGISNNLPDSKSMIKSISEELSDNEAFNVAVDEFIKTGEALSSQDPTQSFIIEQAKSALYNILHDYSRFRIETIDSFFQSILRNLAKELGLGAYLNIELDEKLVLSDAISVLFDEIKEKEKEHLLRWITNYMKEQIESGIPWKIQFLLEDFGENIFKEEYLRYSAEIDKKLEDHHFLNEYKKRLAEKHKRWQAYFDSINRGYYVINNREIYAYLHDIFGDTVKSFHHLIIEHIVFSVAFIIIPGSDHLDRFRIFIFFLQKLQSLNTKQHIFRHFFAYLLI